MAEVAAGSFAEVLKHHRSVAGLTQEELAERANLSARTISDLERGIKQRPYPHTVQRLVEALGLTEEEASRFQRAARRTGAGLRGLAAIERDGQRISLPIQSTSFIGRQREAREVQELLSRKEVRLLTLTGPGGVGKTRLALKTAEEVEHLFPDGVVFLSLASISDPSLVPANIGSALQVKEVSGCPIVETLTQHLRARRLLLVADNFEHLLLAAETIAQLLAGCPRLKVLVTSRAVLHISAERVYLVPPLPVPTPLRLSNLDTFSRCDAIQLFLDRARAVKPGFRVTKRNAAAVGEICTRVDGLPLAIELAAARTRVLPPEALLGRLSSSLELLTGGPKDAPNRHQTLRATVDWSYRLLNESEQTLFRRLAIFADGCSLEAVDAVYSDPDNLLENLSSLVDKNLLIAHESEGEPRFRMLEILREYGVERLTRSGEEEDVKARHATYFLRQAEQAQSELAERVAPEWVEQFEEWHADLCAALSWFVSRGESEQAFRLVLALWSFWNARGYYRIARQWLEAALDQPVSGLEYLRASALIALGVALNYCGEPRKAEARIWDSLALFKQVGDARHIAICWQQLARAAVERGELKQAHAFYTESFKLAKKARDDIRAAVALHGLSFVALASAQYAEAVAYAEQSLALSRTTNARSVIATALNDLGCGLLGVGNAERAASVLEEGVSIALEIGNRWSFANLLNSLGLAALLAGEINRSAECQRECLTIGRDLQDAGLIAYGLEGLALSAEAQGSPERAVRLWAAAEPIRASSYPPTVFERELYRRSQENCRQELGDAVYTNLWLQVHHMTLEQALSAALHGASPRGQDAQESTVYVPD